MRDSFLKSLLDRLNANKTHDLIYLRPLTDRVDFGKAWLKKPKPTDSICHPDGPHSFYFIKNEDGLYVAAVYDMTHDLHWFVLPKFRGQGHLTRAMKDVILFHLFQDREEQRITINEFQIGSKNFIASEKVAKTLGFVKNGQGINSEYLLTMDKYSTDDYIDGQNTEITKERIEELGKQIHYIAKSLWSIQMEVEMKMGDLDYADELKELVDEINRHPCRLEDAWWRNKKNCK